MLAVIADDMLLLAGRLSHGPVSFRVVRGERIIGELTGSNVGL